jgi:hypothetical protein
VTDESGLREADTFAAHLINVVNLPGDLINCYHIATMA